jgi:integrase
MLVLEHAHTEPSKKLNDTSGDSLPDVFADHPTEFVEWDDQVVGLGRRLRAATRPRWIVQTRVNGVSRKRVLGDAEAISLIDARLAAISLLKRIRADDPDETPDAPDPLATVEEFSAIYLADCKNRWKPSTQRRNASQFRRCIVPTFGAKRIRDLSKDDVQNWYHFAPGKPGTLNVDLALLSGMMRHAELLGIRPPGRNPCKGLRRRDGNFKARYLTAAEYKRLNKVLTALEAAFPIEVGLIRFLMLTGCRKGEAAGLRWEWIHEGAARLPDSKTGPRSIWIGAPAKRVLDQLPRTGPFVFTAFGDAALTNAHISGFWDEVRAKTKLGGLRIHDLRHSFASIAVGSGESMRSVAGLLGHTELQTTQGYAHLAEAPVMEATQRVGSLIAAQLGRARAPAKVAPKKLEHKPSKAVKMTRENIPVPPEIRAFSRSGKTIATYCAKQGLDAKEFNLNLQAWRSAGGVL